MAHDRTNALNSDEISTYRTEKGIQVIPDEDAAGWNFYIYIYIHNVHTFIQAHLMYQQYILI